MRSLGTHLWLAMALVALLGIGTVVLVAGNAISHEFVSYAHAGRQARAQVWAPVLADYFQRTGSWGGVEAELEELVSLGQTRQGRGGGRGIGAGNLSHGAGQERAFILDADGRVVADTGRTLLGRTLDEHLRSQGAAIESGGQPVGTLLLTTGDLSGVSALEQEYLQAVRRAVLYAAGAVLLAALLVSMYLSRQLAAPLRRLTQAAEQMGAGSRWQRVDVRSRDEIGELASALNRMGAELEDGEAQRRQMTADIAHELRNPLSIMRGNLEALLDDVYPLDKEHLEPVYEETVLLQRLVEDLRLLSLAESGRLTLKRQPVDVPGLLTSVADGARVVAQDKGITLHVQAEDGLGLLQADPDRLRQVLGNLLSNALRLTPRGGTITLSAAPAEGGRTQLQVSDTGAGISPEDLPHVFDRFYWGSKARASEESGSGLGLAIARALVEAHGGTIAVSSQLGQGAAFAVVL